MFILLRLGAGISVLLICFALFLLLPWGIGRLTRKAFGKCETGLYADVEASASWATGMSILLLLSVLFIIGSCAMGDNYWSCPGYVSKENLDNGLDDDWLTDPSDPLSPLNPSSPVPWPYPFEND